jgi:hypothetical protein
MRLEEKNCLHRTDQIEAADWMAMNADNDNTTKFAADSAIFACQQVA